MRNISIVILVLFVVCITVNAKAFNAHHDELMAVLEEQSVLSAVDSNSLHTESDASSADFQRLRQELMYGQIQPLKEQTAQQQEGDLDRLIAQLSSLNIPPELTEKKDNETGKEPAENTRQHEIDGSKSTLENPASEAGDVEECVLGRLEKVSQAVYPLQLADTLFRQGHHAEALRYYKQELEVLEEDDTVCRQWILFQAANCLQLTDPAGAVQHYDELIETYPNSAWTPVAATRKMTIEWNQTSEIEDLLTNDVDASK